MSAEAVAGTGAKSHTGSGRFPLAACLTSVLMTWLGLAAAAMNVRWGTGRLAADALRASWSYVGVMWMLAWFAAWPAVRRPLGSTDAPADWAAILIGAIPAAGVAAALSPVTWPMIAAMAALQAGSGALATGVLSWTDRGHRASALGAGVLAALGLAAPLCVYLFWEFLPRAWDGWFAAVPVVSAVRAARPADSWSSVAGAAWWCAAVEGLAGIALMAASRGSRRETPAGDA